RSVRVPRGLRDAIPLFSGTLASVDWTQVCTRSGEWWILCTAPDPAVSVSVLVSLHGPRKWLWRIEAMIGHLMEDVIFHLSMRAHNGAPRGDLSHRPATFSVDKYDEWREESLKSQFEDYFHWDLIKGKRVLDFGCGTGPLSALCAKNGAASVVGLDLLDKSIA